MQKDIHDATTKTLKVGQQRLSFVAQGSDCFCWPNCDL